LIERLAQAIDDEIAAHAWIPEEEEPEPEVDTTEGVCRVCNETLLVYNEKHSCFEEFGPLDDWGCDICGETLGHEETMYCCSTFNVCDWAACVDCHMLPNPYIHVDAVLDRETTKKLEDFSKAISFILKDYQKAAVKEQKRWLKEDGKEIMRDAKKQKDLESVLVPVYMFQITGMLAPREKLCKKMTKMGGVSEYRACASPLTPADREGLTAAERAVWKPPPLREKELRREISHMAQQIAMDGAWNKLIPELQTKMDTYIKFTIKGPPKSYKNAPPDSGEYKQWRDHVQFKKDVKLALSETCEKIVRTECHRQLLEVYTEVEKRTKVKKCGVAEEGKDDDTPCKPAAFSLPFVHLS
jgi:hypothetical protein